MAQEVTCEFHYTYSRISGALKTFETAVYYHLQSQIPDCLVSTNRGCTHAFRNPLVCSAPLYVAAARSNMLAIMKMPMFIEDDKIEGCF